MTRTFAWFHLRAPRAVSASAQSAARIPGTLFAAIDEPVPVQQKRTPCSDLPAATSSASAALTVAHSSSVPARGPKRRSSCPQALRSWTTNAVSEVASSLPTAIRMPVRV